MRVKKEVCKRHGKTRVNGKVTWLLRIVPACVLETRVYNGSCPWNLYATFTDHLAILYAVKRKVNVSE